MNKYCIGCGAKLQTTNINDIGYVKEETMDYCVRCYRITHYHDLKNASVIIDKKKVINILNEMDGFVFFMIDFLHLHKISLDYYQQIKLPKLLLISKLDSIPKCLKKEKIKSFLWDHYQIKDVYFVQKNSQSSLKRIINQIEKTKENNIYFAGLTNAGKSTLLNNLFPQKKITTSELPNTTVGFFKVGSIHEKNIFDTPGIGERALENIETIKKQNVEKEIRPRTYPFKNTASLIIDDSVRISLKEPGNLTWFSSDKIKMIKVYEKNNKLKEAAKIIVSVPKETNVHIKNLGFIYLKKENELIIEGIKEAEIIITPSFIGGKR